MRKIIMLSGWCTSGKDLLAEYLTKKSYLQFSFAESLKQKVSEHYSFDYNLTLTQEGKKTIIKNFSIRELLINYAKIERQKNHNVFVEFVANQIKLYDNITDKRSQIHSNIVISDARYPNEIELIKQEFKYSKVITIRINRYTESPVDSESEHQLDNYKFDYVLNNKSTIKDFYKEFDKIII